MRTVWARVVVRATHSIERRCPAVHCSFRYLPSSSSRRFHTARRASESSSSNTSSSSTSPPRGSVSFGVASVRLLHLELLDHPVLDAVEEREPSSPSSSTALSVPSTPRPRLITPAMLFESHLRDAWLDGIDGEETFLISRDLVPELYQALHTLSPAQQQQAALDGSPANTASPRLPPPSLTLPPAPALSSAVLSSPATSPSSLAQFAERLHEVKAVSLSAAFSSHQRRQRADSGSSTIAPPPPLLPPLTSFQQRLFDLVAAGDVNAFAALYSPSIQSLDLPHPSHGGSLLHIAALHSHIPILSHLLSLGADPNARAFNDSTPLHWAAGAGSAACVRRLLETGADPLARTMTWWRNETGRGSGQTAMHWAGESGWEEVVKLLAEWEPAAVVEEDERGRTVLAIAQAEGQSRIVATVKRMAIEEYVGVKLRLLYSGKQMKAMQSGHTQGQRVKEPMR